MIGDVSLGEKEMIRIVFKMWVWCERCLSNEQEIYEHGDIFMFLDFPTAQSALSDDESACLFSLPTSFHQINVIYLRHRCLPCDDEMREEEAIVITELFAQSVV